MAPFFIILRYVTVKILSIFTKEKIDLYVPILRTVDAGSKVYHPRPPELIMLAETIIAPSSLFLNFNVRKMLKLEA